ncbi:MAG TPA: cyclopropane-fatty-acyl-phospholipid synthase family protein [Caulobacteraceae bacterium]|jgi:cyclopropane-fatty-acyl-phospholipid synthase|nr:cyclopropane-fatty-acyl-phospholipid synthase family protein [Caulobacteraceae bacterium]
MTDAAQRPSGGASPEAIQAHYDVSNRFYSLWLDPGLTYSCALWAGDDDTLEAAQARKLDYIAEPALSRGARRVLDIGAGWGSLLNRLSVGGVETLVGLTLSQQQLDHVKSLNIPGAEVRLESWRDHKPGEPYDAIVSVGAFEHFADLDLTERQRLAIYREFFQACHSWLKPGGSLTLQTIAYGPVPAPAGREIFLEVFPESDLPLPSELFRTAEDLFEVNELRNDREHYIRTLKAWHRNLRARRAEAVAEVGHDKVEFFKRYLGASAMMFAARNTLLLRLKLTRVP